MKTRKYFRNNPVYIEAGIDRSNEICITIEYLNRRFKLPYDFNITKEKLYSIIVQELNLVNITPGATELILNRCKRALGFAHFTAMQN